MPAYDYKCTKCGTTADILRPITACEEPPREEEVKPEEGQCKPHSEHQWKKLILTRVTVRKPWGWGSKGNW